MTTDEFPTDGFTTDQLEAVLVSIGHHLEIPERPTEQLAAEPTRNRRRAGRLLAAAAVVAAVIGGGVLVPSTRAAIADLFGIGSTRIEMTGEEAVDQAELPQVAAGLTQISVDEATDVLGGELPDTGDTALGPPEAIYRMPEGGVLLAWQDNTATLWVRSATDTNFVVRKLLGSGGNVESVDDLGTEALLIADAHLLLTPQRRLAAQQVLLWYDDEREYRFEADMATGNLIDFARSLR